MDSKLERKNQRKFREILAKYGISQAQAATLITKETNQKVSTRKVCSWLASPEALSARSLSETGGYSTQKSNNAPPRLTTEKKRIKNTGKINYY